MIYSFQRLAAALFSSTDIGYAPFVCVMTYTECPNLPVSLLPTSRSACQVRDWPGHSKPLRLLLLFL